MSGTRIKKSKTQIQMLKAAYVAYYTDVPVQKYAAMAIERDEDTILRWKKEDHHFADAVEKAKASWIRKRLLESKSEFALERLEAEVFGRKNNNFDLTINLPTPQIYLPKEMPYASVDNQWHNVTMAGS